MKQIKMAQHGNLFESVPYFNQMINKKQINAAQFALRIIQKKDKFIHFEQ